MKIEFRSGEEAAQATVVASTLSAQEATVERLLEMRAGRKATTDPDTGRRGLVQADWSGSSRPNAIYGCRDPRKLPVTLQSRDASDPTEVLAMMTETYQSISEIFREDTEEFVPPLEAWKIEVVDRDLHRVFGDIGGRQQYIANARVRVTEPDGSVWEGFTRLH